MFVGAMFTNEDHSSRINGTLAAATDGGEDN